MVEMMLFHSALGQTDGFLAFADRLRDAGHIVHTPDLYGGRVYTDLEEGVAHADSVGFPEMSRRGAATAEGLPESLVYGGFSLGTGPAQLLAQTRPGALGALLLHGGNRPSDWGSPWPKSVPVVVHTMVDDPWIEMADMQALVDEAEDGELVTYPGSGHLFADPGVEDFNPSFAELMEVRVLEWLERRGATPAS
jgi:dienelactone hydrolase